jgi:hypothetical protein
MRIGTGKEYLWHGLTWATGKPALVLAETADSHLAGIDVMGLDLGFRLASAARFCTGRYGFAGTHQVEPLPCPWRAEADGGWQCSRCLGQDEFRFAHQFHHGGHSPAALIAYMSQPHWLYIATFAHGESKVGTVAAARRTSRLNEQAPIHATYLAEAPDGRAVRQLEDAVSRELGMSQAVRGTAKLVGLLQPDHNRAQVAHEHAVQDAAVVLATLGISGTREQWRPPAAGAALRSSQPAGGRVVYPHDLRQGEHRFHIESCAGTLVLARLSADADALRYVLDLNALRGRRVVFGDFRSPKATVQASLF